MNLLSKGIRILFDEGPISFLRRGSNFVYRESYWKLKSSYELSIGDTSVEFSAPNRTAVQRNKLVYKTEREILADLMRELEEDDVFFDIGANNGIYTLFAAKNCSQVFAFEPYPPNISLLKNEIDRNDASNVDLWEIALSDSNGEMAFEQPETEDIGYGSASIVTENTAHPITVPTRTGDDLISSEGLPVPNMIKLDVEGSEPLVLDGLSETLSNPDCRLVYCEVHLGDVDHRPSIQDFGVDLEELKNQFREFGFTVEVLLESRGEETFIKCYK